MFILLAKQNLCIDHQVAFVQDYIILPKLINNKGRYWRCLKCNPTPPLRFSTMFYKTKLKLIRFVMILYCFTELKIRNTQKRNKASVPHENRKGFYYHNLSYYHCYYGPLAIKVRIAPAYSSLTSCNEITSHLR